MALGTEFALRWPRSAPVLPACPARPDQGAGGRRPGQAEATVTPAQIRALAAKAIAGRREVAGNLAELSAPLGGEEAGEGRLERAR
jgi:hypothetical protein